MHRPSWTYMCFKKCFSLGAIQKLCHTFFRTFWPPSPLCHIVSHLWLPPRKLRHTNSNPPPQPLRKTPRDRPKKWKSVYCQHQTISCELSMSMSMLALITRCPRVMTGEHPCRWLEQVCLQEAYTVGACAWVENSTVWQRLSEPLPSPFNCHNVSHSAIPPLPSPCDVIFEWPLRHQPEHRNSPMLYILVSHNMTSRNAVMSGIAEVSDNAVRRRGDWNHETWQRGPRSNRVVKRSSLLSMASIYIAVRVFA